jgi:hypothetical protein
VGAAHFLIGQMKKIHSGGLAAFPHSGNGSNAMGDETDGGGNGEERVVLR